MPTLFKSMRDLGGRGLLLLQGCQIIAEILDALLHRFLVLFIKVSKDWPPCGHIRGSVSRGTRSKFKDGRNVVVGEFACVALSKLGQVRGRHLEQRREWAIASGLGAMAAGAILFVHCLASGHVIRRECLVHGWLILRPCDGEDTQ